MKYSRISYALFIFLSACIAAVGVFSGCSFEQPPKYSWEISLVDSFDPTQGGLSELPWLTSLHDIKEILQVDSLPSGNYEMKSENGPLIIQNVKLKEFRYPMELQLNFQNDPTDDGNLLLVGYLFGIAEIEGVPIVGEGNSFRLLPEETQEEVSLNYEIERQVCLDALSDQYWGQIQDSGIGSDTNLFANMQENSHAYTTLDIRLPGQQETSIINILFGRFIIKFEIYGSPPY